MTLDTRVYVLDPIDHKQVFVKCNQLIGAHEGVRFSDEQDKTWSKGEGTIKPGNPWTIANEPSQGLNAWLMVHYRPGEPLRSEVSHDKTWCEEDCDYAGCVQLCWLEISFDTAYSFTGPNGEGCGDLHAAIVTELGRWLDSKDIGWRWKNEFDGEVFDRYEGLEKLGSGGAKATSWFNESALPAIQTDILLKRLGISDPN